MPARTALLLLFVLLGASDGCATKDTTDCNSAFPQTVDIVVTNAATAERICDAIVRVVDGTGNFVRDPDAAVDLLTPKLDSDGGTGACFYSGPVLAGPGTYDLSVTKPGFVPADVRNVEVTTAPCSSAPPPPSQVFVRLSPSSSDAGDD